MKNKKLRSILTQRIRNYEEWEFMGWHYFDPILRGPLCTRPAGFLLKLKGKRSGAVWMISVDKNIRYSNRVKEIIVLYGLDYQKYLATPCKTQPM